MVRERRTSNADWPTWLHEAWNRERDTPGSLQPLTKGDGYGLLELVNEDGSRQLIQWGDVLVYINGRLGVMRAELFEALCERDVWQG
jgi:hypothetical protein